MINQDQFDYVIKNLSERGFIKKFRDSWLFTEKGENYTSRRSGNSWIRISYAPSPAPREVRAPWSSDLYQPVTAETAKRVSLIARIFMQGI